MIWVELLGGTALCYFLFNWQFFRCVETVLPVEAASRKSIVWTFLLNYSIFFLCSILKFHLIANWIVFLLLLLIEQLILYRQPLRKCFLLVLLGTQLGLAANILFRSLVAVILNVPLTAFGNSILDESNHRGYPVLLGFLVTGLVFLLIARFKLLKRLSLVLDNKRSLMFLLSLLVAMYSYLCMNLAVYYIEDNSLVLKLWSMKSAIFVIAGEYLAVVLSIRMGQLAHYREKNQESRELMARERERELELRTMATTDPLTGCQNRLQAEKLLQDALDNKRKFCLGFIDLNGLKAVNDNYGHEMGDTYLITVSETLERACGKNHFLFRYGGDEFLMLLFDTPLSEASELLRWTQQQLEDENAKQTSPFTMAISYGFAMSEEGADALELIQAADARMYEMKPQKSS